jgi:hypothetical protein
MLVADNYLRDQKREVVENFCGRYAGRFRYVFKPQLESRLFLIAGLGRLRVICWSSR